MKQSVNKVYEIALGTTTTTPEVPVEQIFAPFIQITVSDAATLDVDLTVEGSSDKVPNDEAYQNFVTLTEFASKNITADGSSYWFLPKDMLSMKVIRVKSTNTAGTGNARIVFSGVRP